MKLKEISNIVPGHQFRTKIFPEDKGNYSVILMRNINNDNTINYKDLLKTNIEKIKPEQNISKNDILFRAKGNNNYASYIDKELENTTTNTHFFIIRNHSEKILPEYLAWYINQKPAQIYFLKHSPGTVIPIVTNKNLGNLNITIPDISIQKKIIQIHKLSVKEQNLSKQIIYKKKRLVEALLIKKIKGGLK
jgi:restriction endonuclease S subunit